MAQVKELVQPTSKALKEGAGSLGKRRLRRTTAGGPFASGQEGRAVKIKNDNIFETIENLLTVNKMTPWLKSNLRDIAEKLQEISLKNNPNSKIARQARLCLYALLKKYPEEWLQDIVKRSLPLPSGGSDAVEELYRGPRDPLHQQEKLTELLISCKLRLQYDPGGVHNINEIEEYIRKIKSVAEKEHIPENYVQDAIERLQKIIRAEERREMLRIQQDHVRAGRKIVWTAGMGKEYQNPERQVGETFDVQPGMFTADELEKIATGGEGGLRNYIYRFLEENTSLVGEGFRPDLAISQKWEEFKRIAKWLWGESNQKKVKEYQEFFALYEALDSVTKAVLSRPKGDKPEESFKLLRFISELHYQKLSQIELVEIAKPAFTEAYLGLIANDASEYYKDLNWLKDQQDFNGTQMTRAKIWENLFLKMKGSDEQAAQDLTPAETILKSEIESRLDRVGMGILLRDKHMLPNIEAYEKMDIYFNEYRKNAAQLADASGTRLSQQERTEKIIRQGELKLLMQHEWQNNITLDELSEFDPDHEEAQFLLQSVHRLSPAKIRARTRIIQALREQGKTEAEIKNMEPKIRIALWAAEAMSIGKGEVMEKGARLGRAPGFDIRYTLGIREHYASLARSWKYHMDRGFAEAYQRVLNDDLFADDFTMGGKAGEVMRDLFYTHAFRIYGWDKIEEDIKRNGEWRRRMEEADKDRIPRWVVYTQYIEEVLGIPYTELLRPNTLVTGLYSVSTLWRDERIVIKGIQDQLNYLRGQGRVGTDAISDYQALGIRLAAAQTDLEKRQIFEIILQRKPSALLTLIGGNEMETNILQGTGVARGTIEWRQFQDALALVEMKLALHDQYRWTAYNLADINQLTPLMRVALKAVAPTLTDTVVSHRISMYHTILTNLNAFAHANTPSGRTRIDEWVRHKWRNIYMVESTSFNWKDANHALIGVYHIDRRMNDFNGMAQAGSIKRELLTDSDFFSPHEGKEVDMLVRLKTLRKTIEGYSGAKDGEHAQALILRAIIDYNRDLAIHGLVGWIPFASTIMRNLGWKISPEFREFCIRWKLVDRPLTYWPRSLRGLVSTAGDFSGAKANRWDEFFIASLLESAERNHQFTDAPELLENMKRDYKTNVGWRIFVGLPRKYWPAVIVATIVFAAIQYSEEERKQY